MVFGAMSALITPFKNNKVDFESYERLIKRQIAYGMDACVPVGTSGESATLSHKEHMECIESAVQICKGSDVKVLAGAGSNSTAEAKELALLHKNVEHTRFYVLLLIITNPRNRAYLSIIKRWQML